MLNVKCQMAKAFAKSEARSLPLALSPSLFYFRNKLTQKICFFRKKCLHLQRENPWIMPKYNITEKKERDAAYRMLLRPELTDALYEKILHKLLVEKKYRDPDYSAQKLAKELGTNSRYVSAVVNLRFQKNYSELVNEYRISEALYMLIDHRYAECSIGEIAHLVGFSNRQSFYAAFYRIKGITPREYRVQQQEKLGKK